MIEVILKRIPIGHISFSNLTGGGVLLTTCDGIGGGEGYKRYYRGATPKEALTSCYKTHPDLAKESQEYIESVS